VLRLADAEQRREVLRLRVAVDTARHHRELVRAEVPPPPENAEILPREPIAHFGFDTRERDGCRDAKQATRFARVPEELRLWPTSDGAAVGCDGDARITVPDLPAFRRDQPFSVRLRLWCESHPARAVVQHTSHYTEDADAQGYQLLLEHGHLCWQLVHLWPGSALAVRSEKPLPLRTWCDVVATYDGGCEAAGLALYVDGERVAAAIVRDHLDGPTTVRTFELGGRDRDRGFVDGRIDAASLYDVCLDAAEVAMLAGRRPRPAERVAHFRARDPKVLAATAELQSALQTLHANEEAIPELMVMARHRYPSERFVLRRGAYDQPDRGKPVQADVPAGVMPWPAGLAVSQPPNRLDLAAWLADVRHPLVARVAVDRLWALCFGRGLVPTPEDFGRAGGRPTQPALLDLLAVDFAHQRSQKQLLRRIVGSATFRQASAATPAQWAADPHNDRLARGPSFRLSAETLRDQALAASGLLHRQLGGPSVKPWQPPGLWRDAGVGWGGGDYAPDQGPNAHRRSLYTWRKRTALPVPGRRAVASSRLFDHKPLLQPRNGEDLPDSVRGASA
jgi:hypothetical protein